MKIPNLKDLPKIIFAQWQQPEKRYPFMAALLSFGVVLFVPNFGFIMGLLTVTGITGATYLATATVQYFLKVAAKLEETLKANDILNAKHQEELTAWKERNAAFEQMLKEGGASLDRFKKEMGQKFEKLQSMEGEIEKKSEEKLRFFNNAVLEIQEANKEIHREVLKEFKNSTQELYNKHLTDIYNINKQNGQNIDNFQKALENLQNKTLPSIRDTLEAQGNTSNNLFKAIQDLQTSTQTVQVKQKQAEERLKTAVAEQNNQVQTKVEKINNAFILVAEKNERLAENMTALHKDAAKLKEEVESLQNKSKGFEKHINYLNSEVKKIDNRTRWRSQWDPKGGIESARKTVEKLAASNGIKSSNGLNSGPNPDIEVFSKKVREMCNPPESLVPPFELVPPFPITSSPGLNVWRVDKDNKLIQPILPCFNANKSKPEVPVETQTQTEPEKRETNREIWKAYMSLREL